MAATDDGKEPRRHNGSPRCRKMRSGRGLLAHVLWTSFSPPVLAVLLRRPVGIEVPQPASKSITVERRNKILPHPVAQPAGNQFLPKMVGRCGSDAKNRRLAAGTGHDKRLAKRRKRLVGSGLTEGLRANAASGWCGGAWSCCVHRIDRRAVARLGDGHTIRAGCL